MILVSYLSFLVAVTSTSKFSRNNSIAHLLEDAIKEEDMVVSTSFNLDDYIENTTSSIQKNYTTEVASPLKFEIPEANRQPVTLLNKNLPAHILQALHPANIVRPLSEKISKIATILERPYQPNGGIVNLLNPSYLWEKINAKKQQIISDANTALFGFGQIGGHDYPFPYRINKV